MRLISKILLNILILFYLHDITEPIDPNVEKVQTQNQNQKTKNKAKTGKSTTEPTKIEENEDYEDYEENEDETSPKIRVSRHKIVDDSEDDDDDSDAVIKNDMDNNDPEFAFDEHKDHEHDDDHDDFAEEFQKHFDDLKDSDNLTILIKPKSKQTVYIESNMPDSIVQHFIKGNESRFFDTENFDKTHPENFNNVVEGLKSSIEKLIDNPDQEKINKELKMAEMVSKHITKVKEQGGQNNEKILNYFQKLADEKKGLKETIKDFQQEQTLKGVFFSQTTPVDCNIQSPKSEKLYSKENKNQGLFLVKVDSSGKQAIDLTNNSDTEIELMLAVHFGKYHTNYILEQDINNISDFMVNFKIYSQRLWYVVNYWLNHTEQEELKSDSMLFFSGIQVLVLTLLMIVFAVWNVNQLKNITNRRSIV